MDIFIHPYSGSMALLVLLFIFGSLSLVVMRGGGGDRLLRDLCDLVRSNPSGSEARMRQLRPGLRRSSARLEALGFRGMRPRSLGGWHAWALVDDWER